MELVHGTNSKGIGRRHLLPCTQSRQREGRSVSQEGGLRRLPRSDGGGGRAVADAIACLVFDSDWVNRPQSEAELAALRKCIERGTPYGKESWQHATAERLGLEASLHPRGRPRVLANK